MMDTKRPLLCLGRGKEFPRLVDSAVQTLNNSPSVISIYNVTDRTDDFGKKGHQNEMDSNIS